jgi:hypothetical protein
LELVHICKKFAEPGVGSSELLDSIVCICSVSFPVLASLRGLAVLVVLLCFLARRWGFFMNNVLVRSVKRDQKCVLLCCSGGIGVQEINSAMNCKIINVTCPLTLIVYTYKCHFWGF